MKKSKIDKVKLLTWIAVLLLVGIFIFWGYRKNKEAIDEKLPITHRLSPSDSSVISPDKFSELEVVETYQSKVRNPISLCLYEDKYALVIYEIGTVPEQSLEKIIHVGRGDSHLSSPTCFI
jgi:hypothetical protein